MKTLDQWLDSLNQNKIDFGLERIRKVLARKPFSEMDVPTITVGGTNGKGSTVSAVSQLLQSAGYTVGEFTSPHIFHYNERIKINGQAQSDQLIVSAFETINQIRREIELSYFEFSLLAALLIFQQQNVDYRVLEVGLGGRLDAVNSLDSDISIITTVDIDHSDWLGDSIEAIASEKAAIMRPGCVLVFGDNNCPQAILSRAQQEQVTVLQWGRDFLVRIRENHFSFESSQCHFDDLHLPRMSTEYQLRNFTTALTAVINMLPDFRHDTVETALSHWWLPGRIQHIQNKPDVIVDVAHNRQAVQVLSEYLAEHPVNGYTRAVFSVLQNKQAETWLPIINKHIDHWFIFELESERANNLETLKLQLADAHALISACGDGAEAFHHAKNLSQPGDRVVVFGSFHVIEAVFKSRQQLFNI